MGLKDEVEVLSTIPLFASFEPASLKLLAFASRRLTFQDGQDICREGEAAECAYVIISGEADVIAEGANGPMTIATLGDHEFFGEIALLADVPRTATVRARGDLVTLEITKELFFRMMNDFPSVASAVMRVLAKRLHETTLRLREG